MSTPKVPRQKRKKPVHNTPPSNDDGKKTKNTSDSVNGEEILCLVCDQIIVEASEDAEGHEAVFCEGECQGWIHRQCAGLTHPAFNSLSESIPYLCSYCICTRQYKEICSLRNQVKDLTNRLAKFEESQNTTLKSRQIQQLANHQLNNQQISNPSI